MINIYSIHFMLALNLSSKLLPHSLKFHTSSHIVKHKRHKSSSKFSYFSAIFMSTGYSLAFSDAGPFCAAIGARLTSLEELTDAWNQGYDRCG